MAMADLLGNGGTTYDPYQVTRSQRTVPVAPAGANDTHLADGASPSPTPTANPWDNYVNHPFFQQISGAYQRYFGRTPGGNEVWDRLGQGRGLTEANLQQQLNDIAKSYQYADYRDRGQGYVPPGTSTPQAPSGGGDPNAFRAAWLASGGKNTTDLANFVRAHPEYGATITGSKGSKVQFGNGQAFQAVRSAGINGGIGPAWDDLSASGGGGSIGGPGGSVFSDPATAEWEQLLRTINQRLQQPQPTYTPAQLDLMQTQATDPLMQQRDAQKQRVIQQYASMGHARSSGQLEQALQDVDRQFQQLQTGQQSQFALNQVNRQDQLFNSNEQRALAGLNLLSQIPQLADQRLQQANAMLIPSNPYQLLNLQNQISQQGQQNQMYQNAQNQQFWSWLGAMLAKAMGQG